MDFVKYLSAGMLDGLPAWQSKSHWYTFQDTNPSAAQEIGLMPDSTDDNWVFVTCAELVDDTVYGYTYDGRFFTMDFEALQREKFRWSTSRLMICTNSTPRRCLMITARRPVCDQRLGRPV